MILNGGIQRITRGVNRTGRPRKLGVKQQRLLLRNFRTLRKENPSFSVKNLMLDSGVSRFRENNELLP